MNAGPELNVRIATEVMGYTNIRKVDETHLSGARYFGTTTDKYGRPMEMETDDGWFGVCCKVSVEKG